MSELKITEMFKEELSLGIDEVSDSESVISNDVNVKYTELTGGKKLLENIESSKPRALEPAAAEKSGSFRKKLIGGILIGLGVLMGAASLLVPPLLGASATLIFAASVSGTVAGVAASAIGEALYSAGESRVKPEDPELLIKNQPKKPKALKKNLQASPLRNMKITINAHRSAKFGTEDLADLDKFIKEHKPSLLQPKIDKTDLDNFSTILKYIGDADGHFQVEGKSSNFQNQLYALCVGANIPSPYELNAVNVAILKRQLIQLSDGLIKQGTAPDALTKLNHPDVQKNMSAFCQQQLDAASDEAKAGKAYAHEQNKYNCLALFKAVLSEGNLNLVDRTSSLLL
ncbi:MAG: hypothetical protein K6F05_04435 [Succinivibrio sp.]|nr:hypothetical protein [Succinivibrio sp.]